MGMPAFSIIDSHLHLWDPKFLRYPWLDTIPLLNRAHLLNDYNKATEGLQVEKMIFVQCECLFSQCEKEAEWITQLAKQDKRIQGIVPWAPLEIGNKSREVLERYSENQLIKGIRRIIQFEPDPEFCLQPDFVNGVKMLADYNMSFDICISHPQMNRVINLVRQCPQVQFILDHIGKPDIKNQLFEPWKKEIKILAEFENVYCKVSGLVTEADMLQWKKDELKPYIEYVTDCFGIDRIVFGGDWPVVCQAAEYKKWVEALDWALTGFNEDELKKIYRENALRFYRL
jgi:L-fuconolactonase